MMLAYLCFNSSLYNHLLHFIGSAIWRGSHSYRHFWLYREDRSRWRWGRGLQKIAITAPFNNIRKIQSSTITDKCVFRYRQSNVRRLLPAFDCCRACGDQIVVQRSDNDQSSAVVVSWEDLLNTWLTAAKNAFVGWAFNFRVRVLLKSTVMKIKFNQQL